VGNWIFVLFHIQPLSLHTNDVDMDLISIPGPKGKSEFVDKSEHKILVTRSWLAV